VHVAELLVFEGELVDCADQGRDVGPELGEFPVLALDRFSWAWRWWRGAGPIPAVCAGERA